jgi:hypothetical protein
MELITTGSSRTAVMMLEFLASTEAINLIFTARLLASSSSRTSLPSSDSPPTMARVGRGAPRCECMLGDLMLRLRPPWMGAEPAADDAAGANGDTGGDVQGGEREQNRLRVIPDQIDERAKKNHGEG